jgi:opacity protein-like surface antigen
VGYVTDSTELVFSLIPDHRGNRVLSSPSNDGGYSNWALNAKHRFAFDNDLGLELGAGYLRGTIYDSVIAHHPPGGGVNRDWNGAWDVNATLGGAQFDLMAEFSQTEKIWPATEHKVSALTLQGRYRSGFCGKPAIWSLLMSRGTQGASGTEWEKMDQVILGLEVESAKHLSVGFEYMFNDGFVPLITPTILGDSSVQSHTLIAGVKMMF